MEILYLNSKDIEEINLTNDEIINAVEDSLKAQATSFTTSSWLYFPSFTFIS